MQTFKVGGFILVLLLSLNASFAQAPPTATETFNLRIRCRDMALKKLDEVVIRPMTYEDGASLGWSAADVDRLNRQLEEVEPSLVGEQQWSHYNPKTNRCYVEIYIHRRAQRPGPRVREMEGWMVFDAQIDDLLAQAEIRNHVKSGYVYDPNYGARRDGWDAAMAYIEAVMADPN